MSKRTPLVLLVGLCICVVCALFPPRRINNTSSFQVVQEGGKLTPYDVPRAFLFSPDFAVYRAPGSAVFPAEVDGGRLLVQLVLIGSTAGVARALPALVCP